MHTPGTIRFECYKVQPNQVKISFMMDQGLYCCKVMPLVLKNTRARYQRLVKKMFKDQIGKTIEVYIDDLLM